MNRFSYDKYKNEMDLKNIELPENIKQILKCVDGNEVAKISNSEPMYQVLNVPKELFESRLIVDTKHVDFEADKRGYSDDQVLRILFCEHYDEENIKEIEWDKMCEELEIEMSKFWDKSEEILKKHNMESSMGAIVKNK